MEFDEDDTPRHILRGILATEPCRSPVTRSTSAEALRSRSSPRHSARLRSGAGGQQSSSSSSSSPRKSASPSARLKSNAGAAQSSRRSTRHGARLRSDAAAPTPQEALKRSLKQKLRESTTRTSLPVSNRTTTSHARRKSSRISTLQEDDTPRTILRNILRTEPEVSLLFQEKAVEKEPVPATRTSSMGSTGSRTSSRLSDLEFSSVTLAAADRSVRGLSRKRPPPVIDVSAFEKRIDQGDEPVVSQEEAARKKPAMSAASSIIGTSSPSSGLSDLDLSNVTMCNPGRSVRGLSRKRPPRILSVTAFEERLDQDTEEEARPARESSASSTLSDDSLSLKTPHMDVRTEKKALQRMAPHHRQYTVEDFEEGLNKRQRLDGTTGGVGQGFSKVTSSFTLNLSNAEPEYTDLFDHATALYAQPSVLGSTVPISSTQDKAAVLVSQMQRDTEEVRDEAEGEMSQDDQMVVECRKSTKQSAFYSPAEAKVSVESQPEKDDAAAPCQPDEPESQTEDEAVEVQPEEGKPVEPYTEEAAESQPEDEEGKSQPEEQEEVEEAKSQPEVEEEESQPEEEEAKSQTEVEEEESQPEEEEEEEEAKSQTEVEEEESQPEEREEEEEAKSQTSQTEVEEVESQPEEQEEEEKAESQLDTVISQAHEEAAASQTDEEEPVNQMEEEDNGKPELTIVGTPSQLSRVAEKISHRAFRSEGGGHVPVAVDGGRDYRSLGAVPKTTEAEWAGNTSAGEGSSGHSAPLLTGYASGTSSQIAEDPADQDDPADQEEWEDEENDETEELSMKTPAFIRAIRKGVVPKTQSSPTVLKDVQPSVEDAVSVKPKKHTTKTAGQKKKEPPTIFTKSFCMGNFRHFANTKVSPDVYPVLKETMEKFFDRMVEDLEAYAKHAKRKTIEVEDVILLLKRQGHVTDKVPVEVLIEKYLDMCARKQLIPCASSGNVVFPKSLP